MEDEKKTKCEDMKPEEKKEEKKKEETHTELADPSAKPHMGIPEAKFVVSVA